MRPISVAFAGAVALAFAGSAQAADLPLKAAPIFAQPTVSGYAGLYLGGTRADYVDTSTDAFVFGGEGRLNWWYSPGMSIQVDAEAEMTGTVFRTPGCSDCARDPRGFGLAGAHWAMRNPGSYAIGVFGGGFGVLVPDEVGQTFGFAGVEGQVYFNNVTLYGQVGGLSHMADPYCCHDGAVKDGWFIRGEGRYFFTPNDKFTVEGGYFGVNVDPWTCCGGNYPSRSDVLTWGATYEHRFMSPLSVYVTYQGNRFNATSGTGECGSRASPTEHMVMVGFRMYVNEGTLLYNDRYGATFNMPKVRALSWMDVANDTFGCEP